MTAVPTTGQHPAIHDSRLQDWTSTLPGEPRTDKDVPAEEGGDRHMARVRRIGRKLFNVAECVLSFCHPEDHGLGRESERASLGGVFAESLPQPTALTVVTDAAFDRTLKRHRMVKEAPFVRFYAAYPIRNREGDVIGSISLVDYFPREFSEDDAESLIDLARLVESELRARSLSEAREKLRRKNRDLKRQSLVDPLLNIWNRGAILRILNIESVRCAKAGEPLSIILVDLDYFKIINDSHGHTTGDAALVRVAEILRSCVRSREALGRYGGEEFLIVLPGCAQSAAEAVAERMRLAVAAKPEQIVDAVLNFSLSAGVASSGMFPHASVVELIHHADLALYEAKDAGRNCVRLALASE